MRRKLLLASVLLGLAGLAHAAGWTDFIRNMRQSQRPQQRTAVAGVRGWNADAAANDTDGRDYAGVDHLESLQPSSSELSSFVKEGRLEN